MSDYAIIQLQGKQYRVSPDQNLMVDRLDTKEGETITVSDVLLTNVGGKVTVGTPTITKASVTLKVVEHSKGEKIRVFKYKSKSKYRKTFGHRQHQTKLVVTKIG